MAAAKRPTRARPVANEVDEFLRDLEPARKAELQAVRALILAADPRITEGIKWNSPSFFFKDWFANVRHHKGVVLVVLHMGAKVKSTSKTGILVRDPAKLLEWRGKDRAAVRFPDGRAIRANRAAFASLVREWIACMP